MHHLQLLQRQALGLHGLLLLLMVLVVLVVEVRLGVLLVEVGAVQLELEGLLLGAGQLGAAYCLGAGGVASGGGGGACGRAGRQCLLLLLGVPMAMVQREWVGQSERAGRQVLLVVLVEARALELLLVRAEGRPEDVVDAEGVALSCGRRCSRRSSRARRRA